MSLHLIRHADAGNRSRWDGPDGIRPLSPLGESQAELIAQALEHAGITLVLSSPSLRCRQTVEPLAERLGLEVTDSAPFAEGGYGNDALEAALAAEAAAGSVAVCSHGDVLPALIATARRRGASLEGPPAPAKGGRYVGTVVDGALVHLGGVDAPPVTVDLRPDPLRSGSAAPTAR